MAPKSDSFDDGSWDEGFDPKGDIMPLSREPDESWYQQWDPLDNGKAGPIRMKIFWICALPGLLQFLCGSLFAVALPSIEEEFNPTTFQSTATLSVYSFLSGVIPIVWGPISDRYSRKWLLIVNLFAFAVLNYINSWNRTMNEIILLRSLVAIPLASFFVVVTGVLSDIFREKERAFWLGIRNLPGFMSVLLGPPIGAVFVYLWGWRTTSTMQACLSIFSLLLTLFFLPETLNKERARKTPLNPLAPVIYMLKPRILPNALVQGVGFAAMYMTVASISLYFPDPDYYGANPIVVGLALVPFAVGSGVGAACGGVSTLWVKKRLGVSGTLVSALFWNILCLPAFVGWGYTFAYNIWLPIFFTALIGFLRTATTPPTLMFCMEEVPNQSAAVNAGLLAVQFVFGSLVVATFPSLIDRDIASFGTLMLGLSILEAICFIPIIYMVYTTYKKYPPNAMHAGTEDEKLLAASTFSTNNTLSGAQREFRESSIGYISDGAEFLR